MYILILRLVMQLREMFCLQIAMYRTIVNKIVKYTPQVYDTESSGSNKNSTELMALSDLGRIFVKPIRRILTNIHNESKMPRARTK